MKCVFYVFIVFLLIVCGEDLNFYMLKGIVYGYEDGINIFFYEID